MTDIRMVPVVRVSHGFEARVVAAKLGSEGIVTQFRGAVEGPYPVGAVEILVAEGDVAEAREILSASEAPGVDDEGDEFIDLTDRPTGARAPMVVVTLVMVLLALALATALSAGLGR